MTQDVCLEPASATVKNKKRGFTLTEIAIVLGIIGLILGAIWVAAAAVYNNLRISKTTTELLQASQSVRSMYATANGIDIGADMGAPSTFTGAGVAAGVKTTYPQAGVFPADMLTSATSGTPATTKYTVVDAWGGGAAVNSATAPGGVAGDSFTVAFDLVPVNACITLLTSVSGAGRDPGMVAADAVASGTPGQTGSLQSFPIAASAAQTACSAVAGGAPMVLFEFRLRG